MFVQRPPLGWNSWNTFGDKISDELIRQTADAMVTLGYKDAGYEYLVIDDCWSLRDRDENGCLVPDPEKFPHGMKALADYVHSKGLKFGMYSCSGLRTCAGYPSSYDHEYQDAATFASWGVDFLKYDHCYFPKSDEGRHRYLMMAMAIKASGRDILFSACNWGTDESWKWMRSAGADMYRSTGDIFDNFRSFADIAISQFPNFCMSAPGCFNDIDMLTVGMFGKGNVGVGKACDLEEYKTQFGLWCYFGAPLMLGGDIRSMDPDCKALLQNPRLLALNQDKDVRTPYLVKSDRGGYQFFRLLENNEFCIGLFNLSDQKQSTEIMFSECGVPFASGYGFSLRDEFTGEDLGVRRDDFFTDIPAHGCRLIRAKFVKVK